MQSGEQNSESISIQRSRTRIFPASFALCMQLKRHFANAALFDLHAVV